MRAMRDERERQDGRDGWEHRVRHEPTCDDCGSKFQKPRTSNLESLSVALFPPVSPVALELGIGDRSKLGLEQVGGVLIFQLLAQFDQLLFECQEPVTDGVRQVAVVHGRIG